MVLFLFTEIACMFLSHVITLITRKEPTHKYCWTYYASLEQCFTLKMVECFFPTHILFLRARPYYSNKLLSDDFAVDANEMDEKFRVGK